MNKILIIILAICHTSSINWIEKDSGMSYTEKEILKEIDMAFYGIPNSKYPKGKEGDIKYAFFLDLEHGYLSTANSRIHLYADKDNWAVVLEQSGFHNRQNSAIIELNYVGNCIIYHQSIYPERTYISNSKNINLINPSAFERIQNKTGEDMELFELIDSSIKEVQVRGEMLKVDLTPENYVDKGITLRDYDNPNNLIGFEDLIRYFSETNPKIINATEEDIRCQFNVNLPKILTIDEFHNVSIFDEEIIPSQIETYRLIAKVLVAKDSSIWKPKLSPNNHWSNWESGHL